MQWCCNEKVTRDSIHIIRNENFNTFNNYIPLNIKILKFYLRLVFKLIQTFQF